MKKIIKALGLVLVFGVVQVAAVRLAWIDPEEAFCGCDGLSADVLARLHETRCNAAQDEQQQIPEQAAQLQQQAQEQQPGDVVAAPVCRKHGSRCWEWAMWLIPGWNEPDKYW